MRLWFALLAVAPACGFHSQVDADAPPAQIDAQAGIDTPPTLIDAAIDAMIPLDATACFGTLARVCFTTLPTDAVMVDSNTAAFSSDNSPLCNQNHDQADKYCVIAGASVTIASGGTLRAFGSKPLVVIATTGTVDIAGTIDIGSTAGTNNGAGSDGPDCAAGMAAMGASGGYGGSFSGTGGTGKMIDAAPGSAPPGTSTFPTKLRGGCAGGDGAGDTNSGKGGNGGGAVEIVASKVTITGKINASGAGGHGGGMKKCGGGGGGSGGLVVIEAPMISLSGAGAAIYANGGGGGQGGEGGARGLDGKESTGPAIDGTGGTGGGGGGDGANGASGTSIFDGDSAGASASSGGGGGGGGGASGFVRAPGAGSASIAPPSNPS